MSNTLLGSNKGREMMRRYTKVLETVCALLLTVVCLLTSCATQGPAGSSVPSLTDFTATPAELPPYRLQLGDKLLVRFYRNPELDQEVTIRPDGKISLVLIDELLCAGMTPAELDLELTRRYQSELTVPDLTVIVAEFGGNRVYVGGEVERRGVVALAGHMTLQQAIMQAGGLTDHAHAKVVFIIRTDRNGRRTGHAIDMRGVRNALTPEDDVLLKPYDIVLVPRSGVGNANIWVRNYIRNMLPIRPGLSIPTN